MARATRRQAACPKSRERPHGRIGASPHGAGRVVCQYWTTVRIPSGGCPEQMTTTRRSNFAAGLRTTILLAALGGLLVVIGYAIGGISGRGLLPRHRPADEPRLLLVQRQDRARQRRAPSRSPSPRRRSSTRWSASSPPAPTCRCRRLYMIPQRPAERVRDRPQPEALGGRGHPRDHQAALRGRAPRRDLPRARRTSATATSSRSRSPRRSARRSPGSPTCCCGSAATTIRR